MAPLFNDAVHWYMAEITSRIVAGSGIPSDRFHLGKIILQCLKDDPNAVMQIDGATGESDTNAAILEKTVKCATCFRNYGLTKGDVMVLMAPSHLDLSVPFYAALYMGIVISAIDQTLGVKELRDTFSISEPKIVFCQSEKAPDVQVALNEMHLNALIVTFDKGDYLCSLSEFMEKYADNTTVDDFRPTDFDPEETTSFLISTSGTTGLPKAAEVTHKNFAFSVPMFWVRSTKFPVPTRMGLIGAPLQWITAILNFLAAPMFRYTKLQSSLPLTQEHAYYLINTYKPTFTIFSPTLMTSLLKGCDQNQCDFSSFELILLGGSAVPPTLIDDIKKVSFNTDALNAYGMSELTGIALLGDPSSPASSGKPLACLQYRIVNIDTQEVIEEANVPGELWLKGPTVFKGYYKNKEATEETFAEDGWFKTGDMFYRDENWNFYFTERIKLLLKYKSYQISPIELENVIRQHPGVLDVAVAGVPDPECGELPVACVVVRDGYTVTPEEIKNLVKESLSDSKQLRGGVIFLDSIPMTATTKVHRRKLKELVLEMEKLVQEIDVDKVYAFLVCTSGTTGKVKIAAFNHKAFIFKISKLLQQYKYDKQPGKRILNLSPVNWISNYFLSVGGPLIGDTKVQSSIPDSYDHIIDIINKYKPVQGLFGPTFVAYMVSKKDKVDLSCFKNISIAGSKIYPGVMEELKKMMAKDATAMEAYGQTEMIGSVLTPNPEGPTGTCGRPLALYAIKLVDPHTGEEVTEPYVNGELWAKGPRFTEYYNDPEETARAFTEDGFFKTGDLLYKDENDNYFYVDRLKALIKYRNSHVIPMELEEVISKYPGVKHVCVIGVSDPLDGERPLACIVTETGHTVNAQDIKDLIANKLSKNKQLRGGVIFLEKLPFTSSQKVARNKLQEMVQNMREQKCF